MLFGVEVYEENLASHRDLGGKGRTFEKSF